MKTLFYATVCGLLTLAAASAGAQDLGAVQARMRQRIATLAPLKSDKSIGESNAGFLEVLQAGAPATAREAVEAENTDRRAVYAAIAAKTGTSAEAVGRQRAKELAERSAAGLMIQREDGTWVEKR